MLNKDYEIRIINVDTTEFRKKLLNYGAKLINQKKLMSTLVFYNPKNKKNSYIRIRDEGDKIMMTSKTNIKNQIVTENEVEIDDFQSAIDLLHSLGCQEKYYNEKFRETWKILGCTKIVFDSYPGLKEYIEIKCNSKDVYNYIMEKFDIKQDDSNISTSDMYFNYYGINKNRKKEEKFTFKNSKKNLPKLIKKNYSTFNKIIKEQLQFLNK